MSQWTHVVGSIQCSWDKKQAIEKLGKPVLWQDADKFEYGTPEYKDYYENVWKKAFQDNKEGKGIPMGSEGSIDWYFIKTNQEHCLGEGTLISIQGDLRDFGGDEEVDLIVNWFEKATEDARFATLTIKDEYSPNYITIITYWGKCYVLKQNDDSYSE